MWRWKWTWQPDRFFDDTGQWLLCGTHGAVYQPGHRRMRRRALPRRAGEDRASASRRRGALAYCLEPSTRRPSDMNDSNLRTEPAGFEPFEPPRQPRRRMPQRPAPRAAGLGARHAREAGCSPRCASSAPRAAGAPSCAWLARLLHLPALGADVRAARPAPTRPRPHTAVIEIKGEIAAGADASAEFVVAAMQQRLRGRRRQGRGAADQLAGRQPGAGRHHQ